MGNHCNITVFYFDYSRQKPNSCNSAVILSRLQPNAHEGLGKTADLQGFSPICRKSGGMAALLQ
jgi:hypothetical protein